MRASRGRVPVTGLRSVAGTGAAATAALALLVLGIVFLAVAGPRESLDVRTRALQQRLAATPVTERSVEANADWGDVASLLNGGGGYYVGGAVRMTTSQIGEVTSQLAADLAAHRVPLGTRAGDWASLTARVDHVSGAAARANAGALPELAIFYRDPLHTNAGLAKGHFPDAAHLVTSRHVEPDGQPIVVTDSATLDIGVTKPTADRFGLVPGSRLSTATPQGSKVTLVVTGIVRPVAAGSAFWMADPVAAVPSLTEPLTAPPYWTGGAFVGPDELDAMQATFGPQGMQLAWDFPLAVGGVDADHAAVLESELNRITAQSATLTGDLAPAALAVSVSAGLIPDLEDFISGQAAVETVLSLLLVGLAMIGAVVLLLAARMLAARRAAEFALMRARGASLRQLAALTLRDSAVAAVPAALAGAALAVAATPGHSAPLAWWLGGLALLAALGGPPLVAVRQHRTARLVGHLTGELAGDRAPGRSGPASARRRVAEGMIAAAAIGGLVLLRQQGLSPVGGLNVYPSAAPVLVAALAALLLMHLYPLALRGLLRLTARRAGPTGFVALTRAARGSLTGVLPAFALVLALTLAAFAGMVRDAVARGEIAASWQATGADAVVNAGQIAGSLTPAAERAIAAVPGVRRATAVRIMQWTPSGSGTISIAAVDPASYAAFAAATPWPSFPASKLAGPRGPPGQPGPVPLLASPPAAAALGSGDFRLLADGGPVTARITGIITTTPALAGTAAFVVMPLRAVRGAVGQLPPNVMLLAGPHLDQARLAAVVRRMAPEAVTTFRSANLAALTGAPLQHGAYVVYAAGIAAAAGLSVVIVLLGLALGARGRELTLARLTTMGLRPGQARRLAMTETLPAVLAAAVAGTAGAWVLAPLTGPALDLSAFTGTSASVPVRADVAALAIPAAGLLVLALATLFFQTQAARRRGVTGALRAGR